MKTPKFRIKVPCCIGVLGMIWLAVLPGSTFAQVATPSQKLVADSSAANTLTNAEVLAELERMRTRIQELEAQLKARPGPANVGESNSQPAVQASVEKSPQAEKKKPAEPFAFADWTWLNGSPRTKELPLDTKFFTPEVRFDVKRENRLNMAILVKF